MADVRVKGFTLLELLVALAVFATVSVLAYSGLSTVLRNKEQTERYAERLQQLQSAILMLERDLTQVVNRPVRDALGDSLPSFSSAGNGDYQLEFTAAGRTNLTGIKRSSLQRVAYGVSDQTLARYTWPVLDRPYGSEPYSVMLLDGVEQVELRFLTAEKEWRPEWPYLDRERAEPVAGLPVAVEVTITLEDLGKIRRLILLPDAVETSPTSGKGAAA